MTTSSMPKTYDPAAVESKWYPIWEERGLFHCEREEGRKPYTIVIPPPNVTGVLHLGHVLNNTLQDILIRSKKMQGHAVCWVPGSDHAGIATQAKVEAFLQQSEGVSRYDLGREQFLERVWQWKEKYGSTIIQQLRKLGTACDWQRERFTLDPGLSVAVEEAFIRMYEKGLIYKGHRIINWCPKSRTALSDEEVVHREEKGKLWHFHYPLTDGSGRITVATTRPETMLGDTAVAVHPDDARYKHMIGKTVTLPIAGREVPIVADAYVDPQFGTGAVKVTPAHDPNDYEIGKRHNLPMLTVMNDDGSMNAEAGAEFVGMDRYQCRQAVVARLAELNLLGEIAEHLHQVGYSERGDVPVEPRLSEQWFVKMQPLAEPALQAVEDGRVHFHPQRWVKTYRHWLENIKDWCISRQLWWGHRIPAYYCSGCGETVVARSQPEHCPTCHTREFHQDEDVLDTWFSSWLWPFSVFGWPEDTADLRYFYPTATLVTAADIIFFWVARMIMAGLEFKGEVPFKDVYFNSLIRDDQGRKMSKSLNNSPDPLDVIDTYGADALRFTMIYLAPLGQDIRYSNEKCEIGRNFATKMWNAARFRSSQGPCSANWRDLDDLSATDLRPDDQWILSRSYNIVAKTSEALDTFNFHDVSHDLYEFVWNEFCGWYLESAKAVINDGSAAAKQTTLRVFDHVMSLFLRLLHPVMPFVTEEIYHQLGFIDESCSLMQEAWPQALSASGKVALGISSELETRVAAKFDLVRNVRNIRAGYLIATARKIPVVISAVDAETAAFLDQDLLSLAALLYASEVRLQHDYQASGPTAVAVGTLGTAYVPLAGIIDVDAEKQRLDKQQQELLHGINSIERKLSNEKFITKAPAEVVDGEQQRLGELREKLKRLREQVAALQ